MRRITRKILLLFGLAMLALVAFAGGALALVHHASTGRLYFDAADIPHRKVGLVLGCSRRLGNGNPNPFFWC